nr:hypothetical protein [Mycobacterium lepromatosis]
MTLPGAGVILLTGVVSGLVGSRAGHGGGIDWGLSLPGALSVGGYWVSDVKLAIELGWVDRLFRRRGVVSGGAGRANANRVARVRPLGFSALLKSCFMVPQCSWSP